MFHVPELNRLPLRPFTCLRREPPGCDENRLPGGVVMHHTEQVSNFWFTHGSFAGVPFALNDRVQPTLRCDEVHAVVALPSRPADRIAAIAQTLCAPFLKVIGG